MSIINAIDNRIQFNTYNASQGVSTTYSERAAGVGSAPSDNVSITEYGDEFVRSSIIKTEDGAVYNKPTARDDRAGVPGGEELPEIDSLVGYTKSQVEQFYYEGRISRYDYDVKMEEMSELLRQEDGEEAASEVDTNRSDVKEIDDDKRREASDSDKLYTASRDARRELVDEDNKNAAKLNSRMSAIDEELRSNEEFEIIESGNDSYNTFRLVQNLSNLGQGVEGSAWNIA